MFPANRFGRRPHWLRRLSPFLLLLLCAPTARVTAQIASNSCFSINVSSAAAAPGDTVWLQVNTDGFDGIISMQFAVKWDAAVLHYAGVSLDLGAVPFFGVENFGAAQTGQGHLIVSWFDAFISGIELPDTSRMFDVAFVVDAAAAPGAYAVTIDKLPGGPYEVYDHTNKQRRNISQPGLVYIGSGGAAAAGSTLDWFGGCTQIANCNVPQGSINIGVSGGTPPYTYAWSGPDNYTATTQDLSGVSGGLYQLTVTDATGASVLGTFDLTGIPVSLNVNTTTQKALCGTPTGCALASVTGNGTPPYSYTWSTGTAVTAQNCALPPGWQSVTVTDAVGCWKKKDFLVENDTVITLAWTTTDADCKTSQLGELHVQPANAAIMPVHYSWSTGDTTATVANLAAGTYAVTVTHPNGCTATGLRNIIDEGTHFWNLFSDWACPTGPTHGLVQLGFNPAANMTFPVKVEWNTGTVAVIANAPQLSAYLDTLNNVPHGTYHAVVTDATGCSLTESSSSTCLPRPPFESSTWFYVADSTGGATQSADNCPGVYARNFEDVTGFQFALSWEPLLHKYEELQELKLPGLTPANFEVVQNQLIVTWENAGGAGLDWPDDELLFRVCLTPEPGVQQADLVFSPGDGTPYVGTVANDNIGFVGRQGLVFHGTLGPLPNELLCDFSIKPADCRGDGRGELQMQSCSASQPYSYGLTYSYNGLPTNWGQQDLLFATPGHYVVRAFQSTKLTRFYAYVPPPADSAACVWPGDADNNNAVNHHDLLPLGVAFGAAGPARAGASLAWTGQSGADWTDQTAGQPVNYKNIDTNGDGAINAVDTAAIAQNWGQVVNIFANDPFALPAQTPPTGAAPVLSFAPADTLHAGEAGSLILELGAISGLHGLAFTVSYDPAVLEPVTHFDAQASWFGAPAQGQLSMQRLFGDEGRLDVAVTRTDGQGASGSGAIGALNFKVRADLFAGSPDSTIVTPVYLRNLNACDGQGAPLALTGATAELIIRLDGTIGVQSAAEVVVEFAVTPNPAHDVMRVIAARENLQAVEVLSASGRLLKRLPVYEATRTAEVAVHDLPNGVYWVKAYTRNGAGVKKVVVSK
jgi:hypothetical protein